mmetsp:Transcript_57180/g.179545  ORF Transcript_57180/g.179545 Transcript_57180/m.179545 type:complete len:379 (+) Transcript_57180:616-1752(+)
MPLRRHAARRSRVSGRGGAADVGVTLAPPSRSSAANRSSQRMPCEEVFAKGSHRTSAPATSAGGCGQPMASKALTSPPMETSPGPSSRFRQWANSESSPESRAQALRKSQSVARSPEGTGGSGPVSAACETDRSGAPPAGERLELASLLASASASRWRLARAICWISLSSCSALCLCRSRSLKEVASWRVASCCRESSDSLSPCLASHSWCLASASRSFSARPCRLCRALSSRALSPSSRFSWTSTSCSAASLSSTDGSWSSLSSLWASCVHDANWTCSSMMRVKPGSRFSARISESLASICAWSSWAFRRYIGIMLRSSRSLSMTSMPIPCPVLFSLSMCCKSFSRRCSSRSSAIIRVRIFRFSSLMAFAVDLSSRH